MANYKKDINNKEIFLADDGYPVIGAVFSEKMTELMGPARLKSDTVEQRYKDIACSLQVVYEEVLFHILSHLNKLYPGQTNLCLAGGCAQNSLANGKITSETDFQEVFESTEQGSQITMHCKLKFQTHKSNSYMYYIHLPLTNR